jgi:hypothetical protein
MLYASICKSSCLLCKRRRVHFLLLFLVSNSEYASWLGWPSNSKTIVPMEIEKIFFLLILIAAHMFAFLVVVCAKKLVVWSCPNHYFPSLEEALLLLRLAVHVLEDVIKCTAAVKCILA